jgi:hypothetical protein
MSDHPSALALAGAQVAAVEFGARPTGRNWYRAQNASIVAGYLENRHLAEAEAEPERFFMNVALVRVLYARYKGSLKMRPP